jgi:two-component sensor histidine kinase
MNDQMSFELAGGPYAVTASRLALAGLEDRLDPNVLFDIRLLVSELVTNCVKHARVGPEESIVLNVDIQDNSVRVSVVDEGPGFEPPETPVSEQAAGACSWSTSCRTRGAWSARTGPTSGSSFSASARTPARIPQVAKSPDASIPIRYLT